MTRRALLAVALIVTVASLRARGQERPVLHITVTLLDADSKPVPVPHHTLLISDNPATAAPREVITGADGTADVRLRPGNYTVESDVPVAFHGKVYGWTQIVDIAAGRDAVLALSAANAELTTDAAPGTPAATALEADESVIVAPWQASIVTLWTPTTRASGFLVGPDGLVMTSQRSIGTAKTVEVQMTPAIKVVGTVVIADTARDVAVIRIDPTAAASAQHEPPVCPPPPQVHVAGGERMFTIDAPLRQARSTISANAIRVADHDIEADFYLSSGSAGGPVLTVDGVVGITSVVNDNDASRRGNARIVPIGDACGVVATAREKLQDSAAPSGTHLPVEPDTTLSIDALKDVVQHRAGNLNPYQATSPSFDVFFLTPVVTYGAEYQAEQRSRRERGGSTRPTVVEAPSERALGDFGNWSEYVAGYPPVLLVRVTPKLVEGFWTKVARGAAQTQGMAIPPLPHFASGFSRMRAYCGDAEVTPIHPFAIEQRLSETQTIDEGLYVFDPAALAPSCGRVKLLLYSEKNPTKPDTLNVDMSVIQKIRDDFAR